MFVLPLLHISTTLSTANAISIAEIELFNVPATLASKFLIRTDMAGVCVLWRTFRRGRFLARIQGNVHSDLLS